MNEWPYSLVVLCPLAYVTEANTMANVLGYTGDNLVARFSSTGDEPATYLGFETRAQQNFVDLLTGSGSVPGYTDEQVSALRSALIVSAKTDLSGLEHLNQILSANDLQLITPEV